MTNVTHAELAADSGSSLVGHIAAGTGATARTAQDRLCDILHAKDFGAAGNGTTDDTDALNNLFAAMQAQGKPGLLGGEGEETRYLVRGGVWEWTFTNTTSVDAPGKPGPVLLTAGKVVIVAKDNSGDGPLLSIHNDPVNSPHSNGALGSRFVHGGYVGPLEFEDTTDDTAPNRHGISLYGVEAMTFAPMFSGALKGDLFRIEERGGANTADAWHVYSCVFEGATTFRTEGWTFNNASISQVFAGNRIGRLWNAVGAKGVFSGPGAENIIEEVSCYLTGSYDAGDPSREYALNLVTNGGTVSRLTILNGELDAPRKGIRISGLQMAELRRIRVVHRRETGSSIEKIDVNTTWPLETLRLADVETGQIVSDCEIELSHRVEAEIDADSKLNTVSTFSNESDIYRNRISHTYLLAGSFTPSRNKFRADISAGAVDNVIRLQGRIIHDSVIKDVAHVRMASGATIPVNSGFGTATSKLAFSSETVDDGGNFDTGAYTYTAPRAGFYTAQARFMLAVPDGTTVQLAIVRDLAGSVIPVAETRFIANGADDGTADSLAQSYGVEFTGYLEEGTILFVSAIQTTGAAVAIASGVYGTLVSSAFTIVPVQ